MSSFASVTKENGGSACKYIKKEKQCIRPCKVVHNDKTKNKLQGILRFELRVSSFVDWRNIQLSYIPIFI